MATLSVIDSFVPFKVPPLPSRYQYRKTRLIGKGSYGSVYAAENLQTHEEVALKKIPLVQDDTVCRRTLREIHMLTRMSHENIVQLKDVFIFDNGVYLVTDLMQTSLHQVLKTQKISSDHVLFFTYQMLRALKYIHSAGVIHLDLKPQNILLNSKCELKICDFGLANFAAEVLLSSYVSTRWYRAPEIALTPTIYTAMVDIWSVGCIFAEILNNSRQAPGEKHVPLFCGKHCIDQVQKIFQVIGTPGEKELQELTDEAQKVISGWQHFQPTPFEALLPQADAAALDLLGRMLLFKPTNRITAHDALAHSYFETYRDVEDEPVFEGTISGLQLDQIRKDGLLQMINEEIVQFQTATYHNA